MFKQFNSNQLQKIQQPNSILRAENCENQNKDYDDSQSFAIFRVFL